MNNQHDSATPNEPLSKEHVQLIAAAFGLPAPAWAQAEVHLIDAEIDAEAAAWQQAAWDALTEASDGGEVEA